jgi:hypothetical protein
MEVQAKFKEIGKEWRNVKTLLPDHFGPFMEKYDLEIVNYSMFKSMGIFFINKIYPKDDIVSVTIKDPSISDNIKEGFKDAFELLQQYEADLLTTTQGVSGAVNDILTHNT